MASAAAVLKRSESVTDSLPEALKQSRYHMKKCFAKYIEKGKRIMKLSHLMDEMEKAIDDKNDRTQLLEGLLGYILCSTQVLVFLWRSLFFFPLWLTLWNQDDRLVDIKMPFFFYYYQEAIVLPPYVAFAIRPNPGFWEYVKVSADDLSVEGITIADFLKCKEMIYDEKWYVFSLHLALIACFMWLA